MILRSFLAYLILSFCFISRGFGASTSVSIDVTCVVEPLFQLSVVGPTNGSIDFGSIYKKLGEDVIKESNEITLQSMSNLGVPYQVTQSLTQALSTDDGQRFADTALSVKAQNLLTAGRAVSDEVVSTQPSTLFLSDATGQAETIKANYFLRVPPEQAAGRYSTKLTYTMVTL